MRTHCRNPLYARFCAFEYRFLPFLNLAPNSPSSLPYALLVAEVVGRGMGMTLRVVCYASLVAGVMGRGMGMAPGVMTYVLLVVEVMGRGVGLAPAGVPIASLVVEVMGAGMGMVVGVML